MTTTAERRYFVDIMDDEGEIATTIEYPDLITAQAEAMRIEAHEGRECVVWSEPRMRAEGESATSQVQLH